jgi:hypothetical protein
VIVSGVGGLASEVRHEIDPYALNLMYHEVANAVGIEPAPLDMLSEAAGLQEVTAAACCCSMGRVLTTEFCRNKERMICLLKILIQ